MVSHQIESHADDSVTLRVGGVTAHIKGATWREANDAAQSLGSLIAGRQELAELRARLSGLRSVVADVEKSLGLAEFHMGELAEYAAAPCTTSASTKGDP